MGHVGRLLRVPLGWRARILAALHGGAGRHRIDESFPARGPSRYPHRGRSPVATTLGWLLAVNNKAFDATVAYLGAAERGQMDWDFGAHLDVVDILGRALPDGDRERDERDGRCAASTSRGHRPRGPWQRRGWLIADRAGVGTRERPRPLRSARRPPPRWPPPRPTDGVGPRSRSAIVHACGSPRTTRAGGRPAPPSSSCGAESQKGGSRRPRPRPGPGATVMCVGRTSSRWSRGAVRPRCCWSIG
jgi:hypothetical protein